MSANSAIVEEDVVKNNDSFSFISAVFDLVGNKQYKSAEYDVLCSNAKNSDTYVWHALSAVGQSVGSILHESILNYIDNVANIDTCNIRSLQSMIKTIGTNYTVINDINTFPIEVQNYIDIFSIQRELLLNSDKVKKSLADKIQVSATFDNNVLSSASLCAQEILAEREKLLNDDSTKQISSNWFSSQQYVEVSNSIFIGDEKLDQTISAAMYDLLMSQLCITYNDSLSSVVYQQISVNILTDDFEIRKLKCYESSISSIQDCINKYAIHDNFDVQKEADNILNMMSAYEDYSNGEQAAIKAELELRSLPFNQNENATKYRYYKELKLKEYVTFIEMQNNISTAYNNAKPYIVDSNYFEFSNSSAAKVLYEDDNKCIQINTDAVKHVVSILISVINNIRILRQHLKSECQRYHMKGTFLLIAHIINQYLLDNIVPTVAKLSGQRPTFNSATTFSEIVEYEDATNYFNISCQSDLSSDKSISKRYWETNSSKDAIGAIDNTNLFETLPTVNANDDQFNSEDIERFYLSALNNVFEQYTINSLSAVDQKTHLNQFLTYIYDLQADCSYINTDNEFICNNSDDELSTYKKLLFKEYIGHADGNTPYYYFTNKTHPSYQIHPYLSSFIEANDYTFAIENITNVAIDNVQKQLQKNIDMFIDDKGYLINTYRNPLNTNTDYQSRYEFTDNVNNIGMYDAVVAYDGWLFPDGFNVLTSTSFDTYKKAILDNIKYINDDRKFYNYYYGLDLTDKERQKTASQIDTFKEQLSNIAKDESFADESNNYFIARYGLDAYSNSYILIKKKNDENQAGELWIRMKDSPLPFLAYVFDDNSAKVSNALSVSQLTYVENSSSEAFNDAKMHIAFECTDKYTYDIYDFYISNNKKHMLLRCKSTDDAEYVIKVQFDKQYVVKDDMNILKFCRPDDSNDVIVPHASSSISLSGFRHLNWYEYDNQQVIAYCKYASKRLEFVMFIDDKKSTTFRISGIDSDVEPAVSLVDNFITVGYKSKITMPSKLNAPAKKSISYNEISSTLTNPFDSCLASRTFEIDDEFEHVIEVDSEKLFNGYSDIGTFGILYGPNEISATNISQHDRSMYSKDTQLNKRGVFKFQLIGDDTEKTRGIDFKFTLPLRMHEDDWHETDVLSIKNEKGENIMLVNLLAARYDESTDPTIHTESDDEEGAIYEPFKLKNLAAGRAINARIDEDLAKELYDELNDTPAEVPLCSMIDIPYLMVGASSDVSLPIRYVQPGTLTGTNYEKYKSDDDTCVLNMFEGHVPLSVSWVDNNGKIKLDFNSCYYNRINAGITNKYNLKHLFLNLDSPGDAGYLNTFTLCNEIRYDALYYIKNISDSHPKFLLSAMTYDIAYGDVTLLRANEDPLSAIVLNESTDDVKYPIRISNNE